MSDDDRQPPKRRRCQANEAWGSIGALLEGTSVVKLFCRELKPNYSMPWTTKRLLVNRVIAMQMTIMSRVISYKHDSSFNMLIR